MSRKHPRLFTITTLALTTLLLTSSNIGQQTCCTPNRSTSQTDCPFDRATSSFVGLPLEQARCLLRHVQIRGTLEPPLAHLPDPLEALIGQPVMITREKFRQYLSSQGIGPTTIVNELGGDLNKPLSPADSTKPRGEQARYFVIHDTSTPNYLTAFPTNINDATWSQNRFVSIDPTITHVYVNRLGQSRTVKSFDKVLPATKYGTKFACCLGERWKGLFIHVELMEPRRCDSSGGRRCTADPKYHEIASHSSNDNLAPEPGFTKAQFDRLALLYVAASVRKGEWLIPSFHAPMDAKIVGGHDDPQNFSLEEWASSLASLIAALRAQGVLQDHAGPIVDSALSLNEAIGNQDVPKEVRANLALLNVRYYSFDGREHQGQVVIQKDLQQDVAAIFSELRNSRFPIARAVPISKYSFSDELSMENNNTSAFNYRVIAGTQTLSKHALGRAIDINPLLNPYVRNGAIAPTGAKYDPTVPGTIVGNGPVVSAFKKRGWSWGGEWTRLKDYQHFEK